MGLKILVIADEPFYPSRAVAGNLIDILDFLTNHNITIELLQPGLREWESNEKSFHVVTFSRKPHYLTGFFAALETSNTSLFKAVAPLFHPTLFRIFFGLSKSSDIIMCYGLTYSIPTIVIAKILQKPVILLGDIFYLSYFRKVKSVAPILLKFLLIWEKSVEHLVNRRVVWGPDDKKYLISTGIAEKKILIVPLSLNLRKIVLMGKKDNSEFAFKHLKMLKDSGFKILMFHGSLDYGPNKSCVDYIVNILAPALLRKYDNLIFAIIGKCSGRVNQSNKRIVFTGYVDNIFSYISLADIGLVPLTSGTGVKNKLLEYFALSKPVITTRTGVENLNVINMYHCVITNIANFPERLLHLLENPELMKTLGQNARGYVQENHKFKNYERFIHLAEELVSSRKK
jgi:glycosyltransferase involved in cell wall biosynthesis